MRQVPVSVLARAGIARRSGRGISLSLDEGIFYLTEEDFAHLVSGRNAAVINGQGEWEGNAWLSPVLASRKSELTILLHNRLFSVGMRHLNSLLQGERNSVVIREYRGHPGNAMPARGTPLT